MYCIYKLCKFFGCCCKKKNAKAPNKGENIPLNIIIQQQDNNKKINEILEIAKNKFPIVAWEIKGEKITIFFSSDNFVYFTNIIEQKNNLSDKSILVENCSSYGVLFKNYRASLTMQQLFEAKEVLLQYKEITDQSNQQNKEPKLFL